ncbi:hypothetical protein ASPWEDRAFT_33301 [Aspergillus wentii DTO 134E9]|uniref:Uncharacterized protein n=1 Tax=Aspergillus wentii DTO 134E9 TaxID=1073089 RepID=A0A1L9R3Q6_ASPWE|nr:uncharacterized protein ASPWEDRAFT_33301 [Aspergillus wentii DTO 134E9]OJJ29555.1 hypothetical protein ASPWEDRAFT_33301 [Aspergillus wentii DTO 134E9]
MDRANRPPTPDETDFWLARQGVRASAIELIPFDLQWSKGKAVDAVYEASYLRAENAYFRKLRKAAFAFQVEVEAALLAHQALQQLQRGLHSIRRCAVVEGGRCGPRRAGVLGFQHENSMSSQYKTIDDQCSFALQQLEQSYERLQQSSAKFTAALRRIAQEYADFFHVTLDPSQPAAF